MNETHRGLTLQLADFRAPRDPAADCDVLIVFLTKNLRSAEDFPAFQRTIANISGEGRTIIVTQDADMSGIFVDAKFIAWPRDARIVPDRVIHELVNDIVRLGPRRPHPYPSFQVEPAMLKKLAEFPLSTRTATNLRQQNIFYVGDLVQHTEAEILRIPNFGRKSLKEVKAMLADLNLRLGMDLIDWPPADFERFELQFETARKVALLEQSHGGATFEPTDDHFTMIVEKDQDDLTAALKPMTRQMQSALREKALAFAGLAARLDNQPGWTGIVRSASTLADLLDRPPEDIPDILGFLYPTALELGSFVELDEQLSAGSASYAAPLDPEMRRPLRDLVRSFAPWLRAFPSIRDADDEASRFLVKIAELKPVTDVVQSARAHDLLAERDLHLFEQLKAASARGSFQGEKAAGRAKRSASNLVIGVAAFAGSIFTGAVASDYSTTSPLIHKVGQFLVHTEVAISALIADLPADLQFAIADFVKEIGDNTQLPPSGRPLEPIGSQGISTDRSRIRRRD
ncbi:RNA polymerase, alpha chain C terminal domain [Sphingobium sp. AP50]|nr:RNA polymerase, alpha chain C terminal domain [Sphingobium sp. AP50]